MDLEQIYRQQYGPLVGFINRRLGDLARSEELAQEAFVRAIRNQPRNPRSWLYTVAANLVRDEGRRIAVRRSHLRLVAGTQVEAGPVDEAPDEDLVRRQRQQRIRVALAELPERDRQALMLKEQGFSYNEIAEQLGLSAGSMGTTLARARKRLAEAWNRQRQQRGTSDAAR
ncbi:MAG TPA: sigma-70 family RNA polymerase sigma factor [Acidobacteriota bacterium]|nr:sigma-70 family RNA polymerase sigma factor [Acidobacteriota bacterium]